MPPTSLEGIVPIRAVVGLGNPGARYERTRHNAGFLVAERLRRAAGTRWSLRAEREETRARIGGEEVWLARPQTFMNLSGRAVERLLAERGLVPAEILVVADDVALPFGRLRIRECGSAGGHRGLLSIRERIGSDGYPRLRIGVGAPGPDEDLADFVLAPLEGEAWSEFDRLVQRAVEAVEAICRDGVVPAMNLYNPAPPGMDDLRG